MNDKLSKAEQELRESLCEDLMRFLDRDVHISGYIVAFVARQMPLHLVEELVDELGRVYPTRPGSGVVELPDSGVYDSNADRFWDETDPSDARDDR